MRYLILGPLEAESERGRAAWQRDRPPDPPPLPGPLGMYVRLETAWDDNAATQLGLQSAANRRGERAELRLRQFHRHPGCGVDAVEREWPWYRCLDQSERQMDRE